MPDWLEPVRTHLAGRSTPLTIFVRDDDAGWGSDRLCQLLEITRRRDLPIDLAAIPAAISPDFGRTLRGIVEESDGLIAVHQHGFAHANHEPVGRACEFGPSRSAARQRCDLEAGRVMLEDRVGRRLPEIFTPPWNRCTGVTAALLVELGFRVLSRDRGAPPLGVDALRELSVHLDWSGRRGISRGTHAWGTAIAEQFAAADGAIGILLHHAVMSVDDFSRLDELLTILGESPAVRVRSMSHVCGAAEYATAAGER